MIRSHKLPPKKLKPAPGPGPCHFSFAQRRHPRHLRPGTWDMLTTLRIKNLALVADLTLELQPAYNVITGETGAGKSMLIGAPNLAPARTR